MITYNNIAELSASQLVIGDVVQILGENTPADRSVMFGIVREASFVSSNRIIDIVKGLKVEILPELVIAQENADTSTVAATNTTTRRTLADRFAERYSVLDFGAVGDGVTDDSDAIQLAIDTAYTHSRIVFFPALTFKITKKLQAPRSMSWELDNGCVLDTNVGGALVTHANMDTNTIGGYDLGKNYSFRCSNGRATIKLGGETITTGYRGFFTIVHTDGVNVENLDFMNGRETHIFEFNSCKRVLVNNCRFIGNYPVEYIGAYGYEAIQIDWSNQGGAPNGRPWDGTPCEDITVTNCLFDMCNSGVGSHSVNTDRTKPHRRIHITNNTFLRNQYPIKLTNFHDSTCTGNTIRSAYIRGILVDSCENVIVNSNIIDYWYDGTQPLDPSHTAGGLSIVTNNYVPSAYFNKDILISDNILSGSSYNESSTVYSAGLGYFTKTNNITIRDNHISDVHKSGLIVANDTDNFFIEDNVFNNVGVSGDRDVIRIDNDLATQNGTVIGNHISDPAPTMTAIRVLKNPLGVHVRGNTFSSDFPRNRRYDKGMYTGVGQAIDGIEHICLNKKVGESIALPRDVSHYDSLIIGVGNVADGGFTTHEAFPFSREDGFRPNEDYAAFDRMGGRVKISVIDSKALVVSEIHGAGDVRWIRGRRA